MGTEVPRGDHEALSAAIFDLALDAVLVSDDARRYVDVNDAACALFGRPREQLLGMRIDELAEMSPAAAEAMWTRVLAHERDVGEFELRRADGTRRTVEYAARANVLPGRHLSILRDVSERAQAEALRARLAAIVDSSEDAIVGKTRDGVITSWNAAAERMFGWSAREAIGRPITLIIPADRAGEERRILSAIRRGQHIGHHETERVHRDGSRIVVSLSISPIRNGRGRIVGAAKIARDVTAQRRAEQALRETDRHRDELLAMLAHELRNPLGPVRNAMALMRRLGPPDPQLARLRTMVERQVSHMARLIDDLLDVSRFTRGKIALRLEPLSLATVVEEAVESSRLLLEERRHQLTVSLAPEGCDLVADRTRLQQVVVSLLDNAARYTDPGGEITLVGQRRGREIHLRVADTGIGLAPEMLERIFEPFWQEGRGLDRAGGGIGLGLTLVREIVRLHGGHVEARSAGRGRGSEFVVTLPPEPPARP